MMKKVALAFLLASQTVAGLVHELPEARAPDHIGHGEHHVPLGHDPRPQEIGGPRPGDPGFGIHTPPNRHSRGEGNEHDQTHHHLEMHFAEQIQDLHAQSRHIHHKHGFESAEAHDHDLKIRKLRNRRRAVDFKRRGMSDEEYDHLVDLLDQLSEMQHSPHLRAEEKADLHEGGADLKARHEEMTRTHALEKEIREIELHYEHIPEVMKNVGNAEERKALHELYEKIHATEDRAERQKLKEHYKLHTQHLHDNQRHHGTMSDEEIARVEELRKELFAEEDVRERKAIRAEIEDIYRVHRHKKKLHNRNPRHPNNLDKTREEDDEVLISLRQKMHAAETREEREALAEQVRDRIHELHFGHVDEDIRPEKPSEKRKRRQQEREQGKGKEARLKGEPVPNPEREE
eukprot:INCI19290.1.p2 GENE.INCI19290.1~~INCI19290.1.p2  ORF type:complete len:403 (+),score=82.76 INCI19290.1:179-1387(+)